MSDAFDTDLICMGCMQSSAGHAFCPACGWSQAAQSSAHQLSIGTILNGEFLLGRVLGEGGFGITYIGLDLNLRKRLAIKEYFPRDLAIRAADRETVSSSRRGDFQSFADGLSKFREEARTLASLGNEPGIVSVLRFLECNGTGYLVMPFLEGLTLKQFLEQQGGILEFEQCLAILKPVMETLQRLHRVNLLHRDLSPDNIYLPNAGQALLFDFGAARQAAVQSTANFSVIVKAGYAPEEQYRRDSQQGPWTDVYGLAATIYRALTGKTPHGALERLHSDQLAPPSALGAKLPPAAEQALMKALAVKADQRIRSVVELQTLLEQGQPSRQIRSQNPVAPTSRHQKLRNLVAASIGAILLMGLGKVLLSSSMGQAVALTPSPKSSIETATPSVSPSATLATTPSSSPTPWDGTVEYPSYRSQEGRYSIVLPSGIPPPEKDTLAVKTEAGTLAVPLNTWVGHGSYYAVGYVDYPKAEFEKRTTKEFLDNFTAGAQQGTKVKERFDCKLQGNDCVASRVAVESSGEATLYSRSLYVMAGTRLYVVIALGTTESVWDLDDTKRFLDSFKIL
jgi:serine/threonine protein kinase